MVKSFLQKEKKNVVSVPHFHFFPSESCLFLILKDKPVCFLFPYSTPRPPFPPFYISLFLQEKGKKKSNFSTSKADSFHSTFFHSHIATPVFSGGLRDEELSDWVSAHQLERRPLSSRLRFRPSCCSFYIFNKTPAIGVLPLLGSTVLALLT